MRPDALDNKSRLEFPFETMFSTPRQSYPSGNSSIGRQAIVNKSLEGLLEKKHFCQKPLDLIFDTYETSRRRDDLLYVYLNGQHGFS